MAQAETDVFSTPGTRVRLNERCAWPERVDCTGTVVAPPADGTYPQPGKWGVLVLLDEDPLTKNDRGWTCMLDRRSVDIERAGEGGD